MPGPVVSYDFMCGIRLKPCRILKDTFSLCLNLDPPFDLNLHGLNFLPGTDIVQMAVSAGLFSGAEMEEIMFSGMRSQFDMYWGSDQKAAGTEKVWMSLIYLTQFKGLRPLLRRLADRYEKSEGRRADMIFTLKKIYGNMAQIGRIIKKVRLLFCKISSLLLFTRKDKARSQPLRPLRNRNRPIISARSCCPESCIAFASCSRAMTGISRSSYLTNGLSEQSQKPAPMCRPAVSSGCRP